MALALCAPPTPSTDDSMCKLFEQLRDEVQKMPDSFDSLMHLPSIKKIMQANKKEIAVLVAGKMGNGKSTLVNALIGKQVVKVPEFVITEGDTKKVTPYECVGNDTVIKVYDTPGLQDDSDSRDTEYIAEMRRACPGYDLSLLCVKMSDTRLTHNCGDVITMKVLSEAFSKENSDYWKKTVIVLTMANALPQLTLVQKAEEKEAKFRECFDHWKKTIRDALVKQLSVPDSIAKIVPIVPAGHYNMPHLFGQQYWLSNLWLHCLSKMHLSAAGIFLVININRIKSPDRINPEHFERDPEDTPLAVEREGLIAAISEALRWVYTKVMQFFQYVS